MAEKPLKKSLIILKRNFNMNVFGLKNNGEWVFIVKVYEYYEPDFSIDALNYLKKHLPRYIDFQMIGW